MPSHSPGWRRNGMGAARGKPQRQAVEFGGKERVRVGGLQKPPAVVTAVTEGMALPRAASSPCPGCRGEQRLEYFKNR